MGKIWRRILIGIVILAAIIGIVAKLLEPEEYTNTKSRQKYRMYNHAESIG